MSNNKRPLTEVTTPELGPVAKKPRTEPAAAPPAYRVITCDLERTWWQYIYADDVILFDPTSVLGELRWEAENRLCDSEGPALAFFIRCVTNREFLADSEDKGWKIPLLGDWCPMDSLERYEDTQATPLKIERTYIYAPQDVSSPMQRIGHFSFRYPYQISKRVLDEIQILQRLSFISVATTDTMCTLYAPADLADDTREKLASDALFAKHVCFYYDEWSDVIPHPERCLVASAVYDGTLSQLVHLLRTRCDYPVEVVGSRTVKWVYFFYSVRDVARMLAALLTNTFETVRIYYDDHESAMAPVQPEFGLVGKYEPVRENQPVSAPKLDELDDSELASGHGKKGGKGKGKEKDVPISSDDFQPYRQRKLRVIREKERETYLVPYAQYSPQGVERAATSSSASIPKDETHEEARKRWANQRVNQHADELEEINETLRADLREMGIKPRNPTGTGVECAWCFVSDAESECEPCGHLAFCLPCLNTYRQTAFCSICPLYECLQRNVTIREWDDMYRSAVGDNNMQGYDSD